MAHDTTMTTTAESRIHDRIDRAIAELQAAGCTVTGLTAVAGFGTATVTVSDDDAAHPSAVEAAVMLAAGGDLMFTFTVHGTAPDGGAVERLACILHANLGAEEDAA